MVNLRQAKSIGVVGSILVILGVAPNMGAAAFAGLILVFVAVRYISQLTSDRDLLSNMEMALIFAVIGALVGIGLVFAGFLSAIGIGSPTTIQVARPIDLLNFFTSLIVGFLAICFFSFIAAFFLKKSYDSIAISLDVDLFATVGKLYLIGAALIIVLGVGLIILFIAATLQIAAFLLIPDEIPPRKLVDVFGRPRRPNVQEIPLR